MLQALGFEFLDGQGDPILPGAQGLKDLKKISNRHVPKELAECEFRIACDVTNPLCGKEGCSAVFGPQKGASAQMISQMDHWLKEYARLAAETFPKADPFQAGTGAAGGMGFAFLTFTNGVLEPGIQLIQEETDLEKDICKANLVITGEGRLDGQTIMGKAPVGVAALAKKWKKPVIAFAGSITPQAVLCNFHGIDAFFPVLREVTSLEEAMEPDRAKRNLADSAEQIFRLLRCNIRIS